jgi:hypothetical protein
MTIDQTFFCVAKTVPVLAAGRFYTPYEALTEGFELTFCSYA